MKALATLLLPAVLILSQGCVRPRSPAQPDEAFKRGLGTVGIVVLPETGWKPSRDGVPMTRAILGAADSRVDSEVFLLVLAGALAVDAAIAIGEGIYRSVESLVEAAPRERVQAAEREIKRAMAGVNSERALLEAFERLAAARRDVRLVVLKDGDTDAVDTVLSVRLLFAGLAGRKGGDLDAEPVIQAQYWLARSRGDQVLKDGFARHAGKGARRKLLEWAEDGARPLLLELEASYSPLAESVLAAVLGPVR